MSQTIDVGHIGVGHIDVGHIGVGHIDVGHIGVGHIDVEYIYVEPVKRIDLNLNICIPISVPIDNLV